MESESTGNSQNLASTINNHSGINNNNQHNSSAASGLTADLISHQQQQSEMMDDEDPLLISQSLTYVTDDGGTLQSFQSAPFSAGFKIQCLILELICVALVVVSIPYGAHGTVVGVCLFNLLLLAWFWYNLVRSVEVTADGTLRFWIGNIEVDVPFDKIVSIRRVSTAIPCNCFFVTNQPYRGFLATPNDGVAIVTTVPSTLFWLWPRSAGKPERTCCFMPCPRLTVVFSPAGGSIPFIRDVESEMRNFTSAGNLQSRNMNRGPTTTRASNPDYLDV